MLYRRSGLHDVMQGGTVSVHDRVRGKLVSRCAFSNDGCHRATASHVPSTVLIKPSGTGFGGRCPSVHQETRKKSVPSTGTHGGLSGTVGNTEPCASQVLRRAY